MTQQLNAPKGMSEEYYFLTVQDWLRPGELQKLSLKCLQYFTDFNQHMNSVVEFSEHWFVQKKNLCIVRVPL